MKMNTFLRVRDKNAKIRDAAIWMTGEGAKNELPQSRGSNFRPSRELCVGYTCAF